MEKYFLCISLIVLRFHVSKQTKLFECSSNKACKCIKIDDAHFKADCSRRKLSEIPSFTNNVIDINLSGNENLIMVLSNNNLPNKLSKLDISSCNLRYIELGAFEKLNNLQYLDISWNMALTLNVLPNITNDLIGSDIKTLKFNAIQCSVGAGITLKYEHLCRLQNTSLQEIEMSKNRIDMLEPYTILSLPKTLRALSAGYNRLRFGPYFMEFSSFESIRYLNLSYMYAMDSPLRHPWKTCDDDDEVGSDPTKTTNGLVPCPEVSEAENTYLTDSQIIMYMPPNLETLMIKNCVISISSDWNNLVLKYPSLKRIFASYSLLQSLKATDYSGKLEEADFSYNFITEIDDLFFATCNLTTLNFCNNLLGKYFSTQRSLQLRSQKYLRMLNLSKNKLHNIQIDIFKGLGKLEVLNLSDTQIRKIRFTFDGLINLSNLDLSKNRIRKLSDLNMQELETLSKGNPLTINLTGNDFLCACETLTFLQWMQRMQIENNRMKFTNFENYTCSFADSTQKSFRDISKIILDLQLKCSSKSMIFIMSGIVLFAFIIIIISGILYRYRWKLRYIYYMTRRSLRGYFLLQDQDGNQRKCFEFDAFISYAEEDARFAYKSLKSKVQSKYSSAKLCYHYEHFIPGSDVAENIVNAVNCSRKTVCILSDHFLESEWCIYEFKMANLEKIYKRGDQNSLLILMFGSINTDRVPGDIMTFLQSRSYLEVPRNIDDSDVFWDHIITSIIEDN